MTPDQFDEYMRLRAQYEGSAAFWLGRTIDRLDNTWALVEGNAEDLAASAAAISSSKDPRLFTLDDVGQRPHLREPRLKVIRCIHNYLATSTAAVEYTKSLSRQADKRVPGTGERHKTRLATLDDFVPHALAVVLRNQFLHASHAYITVTMRFEPIRYEVSLNLTESKKEIDQSRLSAKQAIALRNSPDNLALETFHVVHRESVAILMQAFRDDLGQSVNAELDNTADLRRRIRGFEQLGPS